MPDVKGLPAAFWTSQADGYRGVAKAPRPPQQQQQQQQQQHHREGFVEGTPLTHAITTAPAPAPTPPTVAKLQPRRLRRRGGSPTPPPAVAQRHLYDTHHDRQCHEERALLDVWHRWGRHVQAATHDQGGTTTTSGDAGGPAGDADDATTATAAATPTPRTLRALFSANPRGVAYVVDVVGGYLPTRDAALLLRCCAGGVGVDGTASSRTPLYFNAATPWCARLRRLVWQRLASAEVVSTWAPWCRDHGSRDAAAPASPRAAGPAAAADTIVVTKLAFACGYCVVVPGDVGRYVVQGAVDADPTASADVNNVGIPGGASPQKASSGSCGGGEENEGGAHHTPDDGGGAEGGATDAVPVEGCSDGARGGSSLDAPAARSATTPRRSAPWTWAPGACAALSASRAAQWWYCYTAPKGAFTAATGKEGKGTLVLHAACVLLPPGGGARTWDPRVGDSGTALDAGTDMGVPFGVLATAAHAPASPTAPAPPEQWAAIREVTGIWRRDVLQCGTLLCSDGATITLLHTRAHEEKAQGHGARGGAAAAGTSTLQHASVIYRSHDRALQVHGTTRGRVGVRRRRGAPTEGVVGAGIALCPPPASPPTAAAMASTAAENTPPQAAPRDSNAGDDKHRPGACAASAGDPPPPCTVTDSAQTLRAHGETDATVVTATTTPTPTPASETLRTRSSVSAAGAGAGVPSNHTTPGDGESLRGGLRVEQTASDLVLPAQGPAGSAMGGASATGVAGSEAEAPTAAAEEKEEERADKGPAAETTAGVEAASEEGSGVGDGVGDDAAAIAVTPTAGDGDGAVQEEVQDTLYMLWGAAKDRGASGMTARDAAAAKAAAAKREAELEAARGDVPPGTSAGADAPGVVVAVPEEAGGQILAEVSTTSAGQLLDRTDVCIARQQAAELHGMTNEFLAFGGSAGRAHNEVLTMLDAMLVTAEQPPGAPQLSPAEIHLTISEVMRDLREDGDADADVAADPGHRPDSPPDASPPDDAPAIDIDGIVLEASADAGAPDGRLEDDEEGAQDMRKGKPAVAPLTDVVPLTGEARTVSSSTGSIDTLRERVYKAVSSRLAAFGIAARAAGGACGGPGEEEADTSDESGGSDTASGLPGGLVAAHAASTSTFNPEEDGYSFYRERFGDGYVRRLKKLRDVGRLAGGPGRVRLKSYVSVVTEYVASLHELSPHRSCPSDIESGLSGTPSALASPATVAVPMDVDDMLAVVGRYPDGSPHAHACPRTPRGQLRPPALAVVQDDDDDDGTHTESRAVPRTGDNAAAAAATAAAVTPRRHFCEDSGSTAPAERDDDRDAAAGRSASTAAGGARRQQETRGGAPAVARTARAGEVAPAIPWRGWRWIASEIPEEFAVSIFMEGFATQLGTVAGITPADTLLTLRERMLAGLAAASLPGPGEEEENGDDRDATAPPPFTALPDEWVFKVFRANGRSAYAEMYLTIAQCLVTYAGEFLHHRGGHALGGRVWNGWVLAVVILPFDRAMHRYTNVYGALEHAVRGGHAHTVVAELQRMRGEQRLLAEAGLRAAEAAGREEVEMEAARRALDPLTEDCRPHTGGGITRSEYLRCLNGPRVAPIVTVNIASPHGVTLLHAAAQCGRAAVVTALLAQPGIAVNAVDMTGQSALHFAAAGGHVHSVSVLAGHPDVRVDVQDKAGKTPLHLAAERGHLDAALRLVEAGARCDIPDATGATAYQLACATRIVPEITTLLHEGSRLGVPVGGKVLRDARGRSGSGKGGPPHAPMLRGIHAMLCAVRYPYCAPKDVGLTEVEVYRMHLMLRWTACGVIGDLSGELQQLDGPRVEHTRGCGAHAGTRGDMPGPYHKRGGGRGASAGKHAAAAMAPAATAHIGGVTGVSAVNCPPVVRQTTRTTVLHEAARLGLEGLVYKLCREETWAADPDKPAAPPTPDEVGAIGEAAAAGGPWGDGEAGAEVGGVQHERRVTAPQGGGLSDDDADADADGATEVSGWNDAASSRHLGSRACSFADIAGRVGRVGVGLSVVAAAAATSASSDGTATARAPSRAGSVRQPLDPPALPVDSDFDVATNASTDGANVLRSAPSARSSVTFARLGGSSQTLLGDGGKCASRVGGDSDAGTSQNMRRSVSSRRESVEQQQQQQHQQVGASSEASPRLTPCLGSTQSRRATSWSALTAASEVARSFQSAATRRQSRVGAAVDDGERERTPTASDRTASFAGQGGAGATPQVLHRASITSADPEIHFEAAAGAANGDTQTMIYTDADDMAMLTLPEPLLHAAHGGAAQTTISTPPMQIFGDVADEGGHSHVQSSSALGAGSGRSRSFVAPPLALPTTAPEMPLADAFPGMAFRGARRVAVEVAMPRVAPTPPQEVTTAGTSAMTFAFAAMVSDGTVSGQPTPRDEDGLGRGGSGGGSNSLAAVDVGGPEHNNTRCHAPRIIDVNARDQSGRTALHVAAAAGHPAAVKVLVHTPGVEVNACDHLGRTPLHLAVLGKKWRIAAYFLGVFERAAARGEADAQAAVAAFSDADSTPFGNPLSSCDSMSSATPLGSARGSRQAPASGARGARVVVDTECGEAEAPAPLPPPARGDYVITADAHGITPLHVVVGAGAAVTKVLLVEMLRVLPVYLMRGSSPSAPGGADGCCPADPNSPSDARHVSTAGLADANTPTAARGMVPLCCAWEPVLVGRLQARGGGAAARSMSARGRGAGGALPQMSPRPSGGGAGGVRQAAPATAQNPCAWDADVREVPERRLVCGADRARWCGAHFTPAPTPLQRATRRWLARRGDPAAGKLLAALEAADAQAGALRNDTDAPWAMDAFCAAGVIPRSPHVSPATSPSRKGTGAGAADAADGGDETASDTPTGASEAGGFYMGWSPHMASLLRSLVETAVKHGNAPALDMLIRFAADPESVVGVGFEGAVGAGVPVVHASRTTAASSPAGRAAGGGLGARLAGAQVQVIPAPPTWLVDPTLLQLAYEADRLPMFAKLVRDFHMNPFNILVPVVCASGRGEAAGEGDAAAAPLQSFLGPRYAAAMVGLVGGGAPLSTAAVQDADRNNAAAVNAANLRENNKVMGGGRGSAGAVPRVDEPATPTSPAATHVTAYAARWMSASAARAARRRKVVHRIQLVPIGLALASAGGPWADLALSLVPLVGTSPSQLLCADLLAYHRARFFYGALGCRYSHVHHERCLEAKDVAALHTQRRAHAGVPARRKKAVKAAVPTFRKKKKTPAADAGGMGATAGAAAASGGSRPASPREPGGDTTAGDTSGAESSHSVGGAGVKPRRRSWKAHHKGSKRASNAAGFLMTFASHKRLSRIYRAAGSGGGGAHGTPGNSPRPGPSTSLGGRRVYRPRQQGALVLAHPTSPRSAKAFRGVAVPPSCRAYTQATRAAERTAGDAGALWTLVRYDRMQGVDPGSGGPVIQQTRGKDGAAKYRSPYAVRAGVRQNQQPQQQQPQPSPRTPQPFMLSPGLSPRDARCGVSSLSPPASPRARSPSPAATPRGAHGSGPEREMASSVGPSSPPPPPPLSHDRRSKSPGASQRSDGGGGGSVRRGGGSRRSRSGGRRAPAADRDSTAAAAAAQQQQQQQQQRARFLGETANEHLVYFYAAEMGFLRFIEACVAELPTELLMPHKDASKARAQVAARQGAPCSPTKRDRLTSGFSRFRYAVESLHFHLKKEILRTLPHAVHCKQIFQFLLDLYHYFTAVGMMYRQQQQQQQGGGGKAAAEIYVPMLNAQGAGGGSGSSPQKSWGRLKNLIGAVSSSAGQNDSTFAEMLQPQGLDLGAPARLLVELPGAEVPATEADDDTEPYWIIRNRSIASCIRTLLTNLGDLYTVENVSAVLRRLCECGCIDLAQRVAAKVVAVDPGLVRESQGQGQGYASNATTRDVSYMSLLHLAARAGAAGLIGVLLKSACFGVEEESGEGFTAMHYACCRGDLPTVQVLTKHHASPNRIATGFEDAHLTLTGSRLFRYTAARASIHDREDAGVWIKGITPLHCAAWKGQEACLKFLLEANRLCVVDKRDKNDLTPLMYAARSGHVGCVKILIAHGANVHRVDKRGYTPLLAAVACGHQATGLYLMGICQASGLDDWDVNIYTGETVAHYAAARGLRELLKKYHQASVAKRMEEIKDKTLRYAANYREEAGGSPVKAPSAQAGGAGAGGVSPKTVKSMTGTAEDAAWEGSGDGAGAGAAGGESPRSLRGGESSTASPRGANGDASPSSQTADPTRCPFRVVTRMTATNKAVNGFLRFKRARGLGGLGSDAAPSPRNAGAPTSTLPRRGGSGDAGGGGGGGADSCIGSDGPTTPDAHSQSAMLRRAGSIRSKVSGYSGGAGSAGGGGGVGGGACIPGGIEGFSILSGGGDEEVPFRSAFPALAEVLDAGGAMNQASTSTFGGRFDQTLDLAKHCRLPRHAQSLAPNIKKFELNDVLHRDVAPLYAQEVHAPLAHDRYNGVERLLNAMLMLQGSTSGGDKVPAAGGATHNAPTTRNAGGAGSGASAHGSGGGGASEAGQENESKGDGGSTHGSDAEPLPRQRFVNPATEAFYRSAAANAAEEFVPEWRRLRGSDGSAASGEANNRRRMSYKLATDGPSRAQLFGSLLEMSYAAGRMCHRLGDDEIYNDLRTVGSEYILQGGGSAHATPTAHERRSGAGATRGADGEVRPSVPPCPVQPVEHAMAMGHGPCAQFLRMTERQFSRVEKEETTRQRQQIERDIAAMREADAPPPPTRGLTMLYDGILRMNEVVVIEDPSERTWRSGLGAEFARIMNTWAIPVDPRPDLGAMDEAKQAAVEKALPTAEVVAKWLGRRGSAVDGNAHAGGRRGTGGKMILQHPTSPELGLSQTTVSAFDTSRGSPASPFDTAAPVPAAATPASPTSNAPEGAESPERESRGSQGESSGSDAAAQEAFGDFCTAVEEAVDKLGEAPRAVHNTVWVRRRNNSGPGIDNAQPTSPAHMRAVARMSLAVVGGGAFFAPPPHRESQAPTGSRPHAARASFAPQTPMDTLSSRRKGTGPRSGPGTRRHRVSSVRDDRWGRLLVRQLASADRMWHSEYTNALHLRACFHAAHRGHTKALSKRLPLIKDINYTTADDVSLLMVGCWYNRVDVVRVLLQNGADVRGEQQAIPPLIAAAMRGGLDLLTLLLTEGKADPCVADANGCTAVYYACIRGEFQLLKTLLIHSAPVSYVNALDESPLHVALALRHETCARLIRSWTHVTSEPKQVVGPVVLPTPPPATILPIATLEAWFERALAYYKHSDDNVQKAMLEGKRTAMKIQVYPENSVPCLMYMSICGTFTPTAAMNAMLQQLKYHQWVGEVRLLDLGGVLRDLHHVLRLVRYLTSLELLDLSNNKLGEYEIRGLCGVARDHPALRKIKVAANRGIDQTAGFMLLDLVQQNERIIDVGVAGTSIPQFVALKIAKQCDRNIRRVSKAYADRTTRAALARGRQQQEQQREQRELMGRASSIRGVSKLAKTSSMRRGPSAAGRKGASMSPGVAFAATS